MRPKHLQNRVGTRETRLGSRRALTAGGTKVKILLLLGASALTLTACSTADTVGQTPSTSATAPTTNVEAPTTTAAPATPVAPPTTAVPTVAPPTAPATTVPAGNPAEVAKAEVTTRLNDFWTAIDSCFEAPSNCETEAVIAEYALPDAFVSQWLRSWMNEYLSTGERFVDTDKIQRDLVQIDSTPDGQLVLSVQCTTNGARSVKDTDTGTTVTYGEVGYSRTTMTWQIIDGQWRVATSELKLLDQEGDESCVFD